MPARDTGETAVSPSDTPAGPTRPSWEAAAPASRPAAPPRPAPAPPPGVRPAPAEASRPYYAAAPPPVPAPPPPAAPYQAEAVQYDLAGNPIASAAPHSSSYAAPASPSAGGSPSVAPSGYSEGMAVSWPPPVGGYAPSGFRNTSGEGGEVPPEIARLAWNWGAFFFPVMWCRKHGLATEANVLRYSFLALVVLRMALHGISPIAFVILGALYGTAYSAARIYLALKGHPMGWRSRHFPGGVPEYFQVQKAWMWWGFGISAAWTVVLPVMIFLGVLGAGLSMHHNGGYGNPYGGHYSRPAGPGTSFQGGN